MIYVWLLMLASLFNPLQVANATPGDLNKQNVYQLLITANHPAVRSLPPGEREIFLATLAMHKGKTKQAINFLTTKSLKKNPLAALIKAEAYRRQSVQAADRAGHYAHAVNKDISKLKQASITTGLDEANRRLDAFLIRLNKPATMIAARTPKPVVIALAKSVHEISDNFDPIVENAAAPKVAKLKLATLPPVAASSIKEQSSLTEVGFVPASIPTRKISRAESVYEAIEAWRKDWQSRNNNAYLSHYHTAFKTLQHDYTSWLQYKRRVNSKKSYIKVSLSNIKVIPSANTTEAREAVLVTFNQRYQSSNYNSVNRKQLYMARENNRAPWLILYEGNSR